MSAPASAQPELTGDLWRFAQANAGGRGFQFSSECADELQTFIKMGVAALIRDDVLSNATKVAETRDAIARLVDKMIEISIEKQRSQTSSVTESTSTRMLHEFTFLSARSWICPCYPFC